MRCRVCGWDNADGAQFCANPECAVYLGWDGEPHGQPPPGGGDQRAGVRATLADPVVAVAPGSTASTTVSVYNAGTKVEGFVIRLTGPAAAWTTVAPNELSVYPEQTGTVTLRFAPPRSPSCPAGHAWYVVRLDSTVHIGLTVTANGAAAVAAYHDVAAELVPASSSGRGATKHQVVVDNRGNVVERAQVSAADDEGGFRMELARTVVELPPGRVGVPLTVRAPRRWFGRPRAVPIHATVAVEGATAPVRVDGTRHVVPVFPSWAPAVALATALLLGGGGAAIVWANRHGGGPPIVLPTTPGPTPSGATTTPPTPSPTTPSTPGVPTILSPASGSTINVSSVVLSGKADAGVTVTVMEGRQRLGSAVADTAGAWTMTVNMSDGSHTIVATAGSTSGTVSSPPTTRTFTVDTRKPVSLFDNIPQPEYRTDNPVELGVKFFASVDGTVTSLRFYKSPGDHSSGHFGTLWTEQGIQLARVGFTFDPNSSGWQTAKLPTPVSITAGRTYIVSYFTETGRYVRTNNYFATAHTTGPLTAPAGQTGVYKYSASSTFPNAPFNANYWVDVVFLPRLGA